MKVIAEGSTVIGLYLGGRVFRNAGGSGLVRILPFLISLLVRVVDMSIMNLLVLPGAYGMPFTIVVGMLPPLGVFNAIQGAISTVFGWFLFEAYKRRMNVQTEV